MITAVDQQKKGPEIYIVATAFLALFAIVGFALYGLPFFYDFMTKEFGWSRATVTSGNALGKLVVAPAFGFIAGWLIDRYGPRKLMLTGSLLTGIALVGLSLTKTLPQFYSFYVLVALGYVFGGPLPCQVLISRWFGKNRGKAMGIAYLGIGAGGFIVPYIAAGLEKPFGWHIALAGIGVIIVLVSFPFTFFIREHKPVETEQKKRETPVSVKTVLQNPNFYLLALGSMCSIGAVGGVIQHLKLYLVDHSFSQISAAKVSSFVLAFSLAGRLLMGFMADRINRKYVMVIIYLLVGCSIPLLLLPDFYGRIYLFAFIFGIGLGGDYMIIPLMAGDLFGVNVLGRVMGIVLVADGIAEATFPMIVGRLYDTYGSYNIGFSLLIGLALLGVLIISFLPKTRQTHLGQ